MGLGMCAAGVSSCRQCVSERRVEVPRAMSRAVAGNGRPRGVGFRNVESAAELLAPGRRAAMLWGMQDEEEGRRVRRLPQSNECSVVGIG